jgi:hypothetical protein
MNTKRRPKLHLPLALLAALPAAARSGRREPLPAPRADDLRRLVAAMVD